MMQVWKTLHRSVDSKQLHWHPCHNALIGELHTISLCRLVKQYTDARCLLSCTIAMKSTCIHFQAITSPQLVLKQPLLISWRNATKIQFHLMSEGYSVPLQTIFMKVDETWCFWLQFLMEDFASYLALFIGVRTRSWNLRMAGIKEMAPLWYLTELLTRIPHHLTEVTSYAKGGFNTPTKWWVLCFHYWHIHALWGTWWSAWNENQQRSKEHGCQAHR